MDMWTRSLPKAEQDYESRGKITQFFAIRTNNMQKSTKKSKDLTVFLTVFSRKQAEKE